MGFDPATRGLVFYEDGRALWRVTWTLACAFLLVTGLMREDGALLWPLFAGLAALLLWIGTSCVGRRAKPLLSVLPRGLCIHAGGVGPGAFAGRVDYVVPWEDLSSLAFEQRSAHRGRDGQDMTVTALAFGLREAAQGPEGRRGLLEQLMGRRGELALGEQLVWNSEARCIDLLARPRGGYARLTAAIAHHAPWLGDPSSSRREGLGGPIAYALYDCALAICLVSMLVLLASDHGSMLRCSPRSPASLSR